MALVNMENYGFYQDLVKKGKIKIYTKDIDKSNIDAHFKCILNILSDGIELTEVHKMIISVIFTDGLDIDLTIFDYTFNLILWSLPVNVDDTLDSLKLFWAEDITKDAIKEYIDHVFVKQYRTKIDYMFLNNLIDSVFCKFRSLKDFQMYLMNTVNLEDTLDLMNRFPEFNDTVHLDLSNVPIEDVKDVGMKAANLQIDYIKNSNHCLRDSFRAKEAISPKQFKEVNTNIGSKPDGQGGVYPQIINTSFINGGLNTPEAACIESSVGRVAQILQKTNVGVSGAFARILGLNNIDTTLHHDPNYSCDTKNFERITIKTSTILKMYDMRYYRTSPKGIDKVLDADKDKHLIGQTLYFRSPMTCASFAAGHGICYKCYGDLAYVNRDINIGKIAAELLSSIYTQILLSAKHLLESLVIKMNWTAGFDDFFTVTFNTIQLREDCDFSNVKISIDMTEVFEEDEYDGTDFNEYITSFNIVYPDGTIRDIHTSESDSIYIHPDLADYIDKLQNGSEDDIVEIELNNIKNIPVLFALHINNKELSKTMNDVKAIINNKKITKSHDRNTILESFIDTNIEGGINLNAIHFEILLANQIRNAEDMFEMPNWEYENEQCQLLTLNEALTNHRSITVRLEYAKIGKTLIAPSSFKVSKASNVDLFFMEKPQEFLSDKTVVVDRNMLINDVESNKINPIYFFEKENKPEQECECSED